MVAFFSHPLCLGTEGQLNLLMLLEPVTLFLNEGLEKIIVYNNSGFLRPHSIKLEEIITILKKLY